MNLNVVVCIALESTCVGIVGGGDTVDKRKARRNGNKVSVETETDFKCNM